ncbi:MAG: hypothetical protein ACTSW1_02975 [Candidatus Hodarchaeales archaeon]
MVRIKNESKDLRTCPKCKRTFALSYARTFGCTGCDQSYFTCGHVKCPFCGHEW